MGGWNDGSDKVIDAVSGLVAEANTDLGFDQVMVTKAVIVAHVVDQDGHRNLHILRDRDIADWEIRGMFAEVESDLSAFAVIDFMEED